MSIEAMKLALAALETCRIRSVSEWSVEDITPKNVTAAIAALRTAIQQAEAQQPATGEPVAQWQKRHPVRTGGRWISTDEHDAKWWSERATGWEARALYTRPAPSVPITPASRSVIMATRTANADADEWPEPWAYQRGWNNAEAHHGITAQPKKET